MKLQPVKVFHPDDKGILMLVRVISEADILNLAEEKLNKKKFNKRKKTNSELFTPNETIAKQN